MYICVCVCWKVGTHPETLTLGGLREDHDDVVRPLRDVEVHVGLRDDHDVCVTYSFQRVMQV